MEVVFMIFGMHFQGCIAWKYLESALPGGCQIEHSIICGLLPPGVLGG